MNGTVVIDRLVDAELVSRILAGETPLFESIVRRHQDRVYGIASRFLGRGAEAEDAAQEVFLRAYRGLEGFKGNSTLSPWLYRIAFNLCTDALRRRGSPVLRAETLDERAEIPDTRSNPEAAAVSSEEREAVARAVEGLEEPYREAVVLRYYEGLPVEEIAAALGVPFKTAETRLYRARKALRKSLAVV